MDCSTRVTPALHLCGGGAGAAVADTICTATHTNGHFSGDLIIVAGSRKLFHLPQTKKLRVFVQVPQEMARISSCFQKYPAVQNMGDIVFAFHQKT